MACWYGRAGMRMVQKENDKLQLWPMAPEWLCLSSLLVHRHLDHLPHSRLGTNSRSKFLEPSEAVSGVNGSQIRGLLWHNNLALLPFI